MMQYGNAMDCSCYAASCRPTLTRDLSNVRTYPWEDWYHILISHIIATCIPTRRNRSHIG